MPVPARRGSKLSTVDQLTDEVVAEIVARVEPAATVTRTEAMPGGLSSWMTSVEVERLGGHRHRLVIRRGRRPDAERHTLPFATEFALLRALAHAGIPVAEPRWFDGTGDIVAQDYIVLDYVPGRTRFALDDPLPTARRMAEVMAAIHDVDVTTPSFPALPRHVDRIEEWIIRGLDRRPPDDSLREELVRQHLEPRWPPPDGEVCLLHADFFPGNIVWDAGDIAAVIDWESAALGDPMADVATTRLDLWWLFGAGAADAFTERYLALTARSPGTMPVWELVVSLRPAGDVSLWASDMADHGRPDVTAATMRAAQHDYVDAALDRLRGGWRRNP